MKPGPGAEGLRRSIVWCVITLAGVAGCGEDSFVAPPDCGGRFLVAFSGQTAVDQADVYLFDYDDFGFHGLPGLNNSGLQEFHPTVTRDHRFIAFERVLSATASEIYVYDRCTAGTVAPESLNVAGIDREPAFSGNGRMLAFIRDTLGNREVRLYDGQAHKMVPLPGIAGTGTYVDSDPVPNEDAALIVFSSNRSGNDDILVYSAVLDSIIDYPGLNSPASDVDPSITPNGRYLVFASDRATAGDYDLYLYDLSTKAFITLPAVANTPDTERHPSINVDSDRIAFVSNRAGSRGTTDVYLLTRSTAAVSGTAGTSVPDSDPWIVWQ